MFIYPPNQTWPLGARRPAPSDESSAAAHAHASLRSKAATPSPPAECLSTALASPRAVHRPSTCLGDSMRRLACAAYGDPTSGRFTTEAGARTRTDALPSVSTGVYRRTATSRRCTQQPTTVADDARCQSADRRCQTGLAARWRRHGLLRLRCAAHSRCSHSVAARHARHVHVATMGSIPCTH